MSTPCARRRGDGLRASGGGRRKAVGGARRGGARPEAAPGRDEREAASERRARRSLLLSLERSLPQDAPAAGLVPAWRTEWCLLPGGRELLHIHDVGATLSFDAALAGPPPHRVVVYLPPVGEHAVGVLAEVVAAERCPDDRLYVLVRGLAKVHVAGTASVPHLAADGVSVAPDDEDLAACGGDAARAASQALRWAREYETRLDAHAEECQARGGVRASVPVVARERGFEVCPVAEGAGPTAAHLAEELGADDADGVGVVGALSSVESAVWDSLATIRALQDELLAADRSAPVPPAAARALQRVEDAAWRRALHPDTADARWPVRRRAQRLSYALASSLPEVGRGDGRRALLELPSTAARLEAILRVLRHREASLAALANIERIADE